MADDQPNNDPADSGPSPPNPILGTLYIMGGIAMILIAAALGYADMIAWSFSLALFVVGVTGIGAGGYILYRTFRER